MRKTVVFLLLMLTLALVTDKMKEDTQASVLKEPITIGVNDKLMNDTNKKVFEGSRKHDRIDNHILYEELCDRYDELSVISFPTDKYDDELSKIESILLRYADITISYNTTEASNQFKHVDELLCHIEEDMQTLDGYKELSNLYDSSTEMLQYWDYYKDIAHTYEIDIPEETQEYLDKALELSNKIGQTNYFDLSVQELNDLQNQVDDTTSYISKEYTRLLEYIQSENISVS